MLRSLAWKELISKSLGWRRSIGAKLLIAFLASIVLTSAVAGWTAYTISSNALKNKIGNNMEQVVQDAAINADRWLRVMDGIFYQLGLYADKNQFLTKDLNKLRPQEEPEASEFAQLEEQIKQLDQEIVQYRERQSKATDSQERIKLNDAVALANQTKNRLQTRYNELAVDIIAVENSISNYISSIATTNSDMVYSIGIIRFNGKDHQFTQYSKTKKEGLYNSPWAQRVLEEKGKNVFLPPQQGSYLFNDDDVRVFGLAKAYYSNEDLKWTDIIVIEFKLQYLETMLKPITFGGIGDIHLIDENGVNVYSNRETVAFGQPAAVATSGEAGLNTYRDESSGESYLTTFRSLENRTWTLAGAIPVDRLLEDAHTIRTGLIWLIIGGCLLAVAIGYWGYRHIGKPLLFAQQKMRQAENGDLNVRLNFKRLDEIGAVGRSFDKMLEQIGGIVLHTGQSADRLMAATEQINELVVRSQSASKEIAVAMEEVSQGAESLAKDAEKSSVLTGELNSRLEDALQQNSAMREISLQVEQSSRNGVASMDELSRHNRDVEQVVSSLVEKIDGLKAGTESITVIMDILENIAKQINILSLNASIVAASAGDAGKGFMVVANEIRNLANQSKESIGSVSSVIAKIQGDMADTSRLVTESLPIFERQSEVSKASQTIFQEVERSMQQFIERFEKVWESLQFSMKGQNELSNMLMQVSAVSEESTAATENVASLVNQQYESSVELVETSEKLKQLAEDLRKALGVFQSAEK